MRKLLLQDDGIALVLALVVMLVLTSGAATAYFYAQANYGQSTSSRSQGDAYHAAESGLSAAIAVVQNPNNNDQSTTLFGSTAGQLTLVCVDPNVSAVNGACPAGQRTWATYQGSLDTSGASSVWTLSSTGYAYNPAGGTAPLQHTVGAQIVLQAEN
ncbi:MAG TPA: hypothetical protein VHV52_05465, partial [Gaiellaceae bacterium]|nr:hypothetical protein [Gaiellaceae bacterium]